MVLMIITRSNRSRGIPWGDLMSSVPLKKTKKQYFVNKKSTTCFLARSKFFINNGMWMSVLMSGFKILQLKRVLPNETVSSVGCEHYDWGDGALQSSVQVSETLDIQHVNLIDEQNARHEFCHTLIYVLVHHLVNLPS